MRHMLNKELYILSLEAWDSSPSFAKVFCFFLADTVWPCEVIFEAGFPPINIFRVSIFPVVVIIYDVSAYTLHIED